MSASQLTATMPIAHPARSKFPSLSAHEKAERLGKHPFLARFPEYARAYVGEWLAVLAAREQVYASFAPWHGDKDRRQEVRYAFDELVLGPKPRTLEHFLGLAEAAWIAERSRAPINGPTKDKIISILEQGPLKATEVLLLRKMLRDNGIVFENYSDYAFTANITFSTKLADMHTFIIAKESIGSYMRGFSPPGGWADLGGFFVLITEGLRHLMSEESYHGWNQMTVQHEAQHVFDMRAGIEFDNKEYTAFLAGLAFGSARHMLMFLLDAGRQSEPHSSALLRIRKEICNELGISDTQPQLSSMPDAELRAVARKLLNHAYAEKTGFSYDELVAPFA